MPLQLLMMTMTMKTMMTMTMMLMQFVPRYPWHCSHWRSSLYFLLVDSFVVRLLLADFLMQFHRSRIHAKVGSSLREDRP